MLAWTEAHSCARWRTATFPGTLRVTRRLCKDDRCRYQTEERRKLEDGGEAYCRVDRKRVEEGRGMAAASVLGRRLRPPVQAARVASGLACATANPPADQ